MLWQTVQFLVHAWTRMIVDSCVAVPAASSMWTVQRRRSCEDRSGLCMSLERQGRHVQLNAGTDGWGSRRPVDTWWREIVRRQVVKTVEYQHAQFKFYTLSDGQPMQNVGYCIDVYMCVDVEQEFAASRQRPGIHTITSRRADWRADRWTRWGVGVQDSHQLAVQRLGRLRLVRAIQERCQTVAAASTSCCSCCCRLDILTGWLYYRPQYASCLFVRPSVCLSRTGS